MYEGLEFDKDDKFKLAGDSASMGYAAFLKDEKYFAHSDEQRSEIFMNCMFVHLAQLFIIVCIWKYVAVGSTFNKGVPKDELILIARFLASLFMHVCLERTERTNLSMMKYAVNHHEKFHNPYAAFAFGFVSLMVTYTIEITVIIILTGKETVMDVILGYMSFFPILYIPIFYYSTLNGHAILECTQLELQFTKFRRDNPLKDADCSLKVLRILYKIPRTVHCAVNFYFLPFCVIFFNYKFMLANTNENCFWSTNPDECTAANGEAMIF